MTNQATRNATRALITAGRCQVNCLISEPEALANSYQPLPSVANATLPASIRSHQRSQFGNAGYPTAGKRGRRELPCEVRSEAEGVLGRPDTLTEN